MTNNMHTFKFFDHINVSIPDTDWVFLCKCRWFTETPSYEDIRAEFVSGTGITPNKPNLWEEASSRFHDYVTDLQIIMTDAKL